MVYNENLSNSIREVILRLGLYDTGALYRSIIVFSSSFDNEIILEIHAKEYLKYLWEPYDILNAINNDFEVSLEFNNLVKEYIERQIEAILRGEDVDVEDIILNINFNYLD